MESARGHSADTRIISLCSAHFRTSIVVILLNGAPSIRCVLYVRVARGEKFGFTVKNAHRSTRARRAAYMTGGIELESRRTFSDVAARRFAAQIPRSLIGSPALPHYPCARCRDNGARYLRNYWAGRLLCGCAARGPGRTRASSLDRGHGIPRSVNDISRRYL